MRRYRESNAIQRAMGLVLILELAGALALVVGWLNNRELASQSGQLHQIAADTETQVSAIITYINTSQASSKESSKAFVDLLAAECSLLIDIDERLGAHPSDDVLRACGPIALPSLTPIPGPSNNPTPAPTFPPPPPRTSRPTAVATVSPRPSFSPTQNPTPVPTASPTPSPTPCFIRPICI